MSHTVEPVLEHQIYIEAPPEEVWDLVGDVRRMSEWSPSVQSTRLRAGHDQVALGAELTNLNAMADYTWVTHATIVRYEPHREIAFKVTENWAIWSFRLDPVGAGTQLTQRRDTPDGISDLSLELTDATHGGQEAFTATLNEEMVQTLARIKDAATQA